MDSNKVQVHNNEQEKVVTEKNVSPQNEGSPSKKTRLQKTKNETNTAHNSLKASKKQKNTDEQGEMNQFEENSKQANSFELQNKQNTLQESNALQQNLGLHFHQEFLATNITKI